MNSLGFLRRVLGRKMCKAPVRNRRHLRSAQSFRLGRTRRRLEAFTPQLRTPLATMRRRVVRSYRGSAAYYL